MKALAWSALVGGALCLAMPACSAGSENKPGLGSGANGSGASTAAGGSQPNLGGSVGTGATVNIGGLDGGGTGGGAPQCQSGGVDFVPKVPTVLLMVDRSGTMFTPVPGSTPQTTPWDVLRDGVLPVVDELSEQVRFGLMAVTGEAGQCPLLDEVVPADNNYEAVAAKYAALMRPLKGESPGMLGLSRAYEILSADPTPGDKYVLFVTDGEQDYCGDGNPLCPTDSVVYWLQKLKALNVTTLIFGLPSAGGGAAELARYEAVLQAFANAGAGQPTAPVSVNPGQATTPEMAALDTYNQCFYGGDANALGWQAELVTAAKVDDPATAGFDESKTLGNYAALGGTAKVFKPDPTDQAALAEEFSKVLAGVKSCTFDLPGDIKVDLDRLSEAAVYVQGVAVPLDLTMMNGWYMPTATQIELVGAACENWRMPQNNDIDWGFPCDIIVPK